MPDAAAAAAAANTGMGNANTTLTVPIAVCVSLVSFFGILLVVQIYIGKKCVKSVPRAATDRV